MRSMDTLALLHLSTVFTIHTKKRTVLSRAMAYSMAMASHTRRANLQLRRYYNRRDRFESCQSKTTILSTSNAHGMSFYAFSLHFCSPILEWPSGRPLLPIFKALCFGIWTTRLSVGEVLHPNTPEDNEYPPTLDY